MHINPPRRRMLIAYVGMILVFASAAARAVFQLEDRSVLPLMVGLLVFYLILLLAEPFLLSRRLESLHLINGFQTVIPLLLILFVDNLDYFSLLFIPPSLLSILYLPRKAAMVWIGAIILLMVAALLVSFPFSESIGYIIIYPVAIFLFTILNYLAKQAEDAQNRSEALLIDLQNANLKLQAYSDQVEELTAANERSRLARELHDSVTQIIFGLTLSAQAARILIERDPNRAVTELDHLQVLAQNALAEMRGLVQELHSQSDTEKDLGASLRQLVVERQSNHGLKIDLQLKGTRLLPAKIAGELLRISQEALNNIVKHAHTDQAVLTLDLEDPKRVFLSIEDEGVGFDPTHAKPLPGHLGLTSMQERVQALGGNLEIDSKPGLGTRLQVDIALEPEVEHAR